MSGKRLFAVSVILLCLAASGMAQTAEVGQPAQLTDSVQQTFNVYPFPAWNGTEWGVAHMRIYGEYTLHILRCTEDGTLIEGHELFGKDKKFDYWAPQLSAHEKGWALTFSKRGNSDRNDRSGYFYLLNKNARKTGIDATIFSRKLGGILRPIPVGQMFVIFYYAETSNGRAGIYVAYIDRNGKRVVPDRQITYPKGEHHILTTVTPTREGFALMGMTMVGDQDFRSAFFMLVGLDGSILTKLTKIDNSTTNIHPRSALWNGRDFAVAATENLYFDDQDYAPITRLISTNGSWNGGTTRHLPQARNAHLGLGYNGIRYVAMITTTSNGTAWCQELDDKVRVTGPKVMIDDSAIIDYSSTTACAGSMTGFFAVMAKVQGGQTLNLFYTRVDFPHSGKPDIAFFNTKVHEFNGKKYVLLDWLVAGAQQITMKTKGGRWKLPATGFHAVEVDKKSRFKIVASNGSGSAKAKVKINP